MNVTVGNVVFDNVAYDRKADVLYLHVGDPATAVDFEESPEGHALRYDAADHQRRPDRTGRRDRRGVSAATVPGGRHQGGALLGVYRSGEVSDGF
jgi:hypothetical protein